ncbi:MAG TPA: response regulator, partial [Brevundimonas sp.]|nr:response regulator [Brevundimonas sp.]
MLDRPLHIGTTLSRAPAISPAPLLRAVLVDDEPLALETLAMNLRRLGGVEILGRATNPFTGLEMVETLKPDLLFLDVRMPGLDGFEFASRLPSTDRPMIIFVTAHDNLGSRAFD